MAARRGRDGRGDRRWGDVRGTGRRPVRGPSAARGYARCRDPRAAHRRAASGRAGRHRGRSRQPPAPPRGAPGYWAGRPAAADGLGGRRPRREALAIMRRPDIGPMGVAALLLVVLLQITALAAIPPGGLSIAALVLAAGTGRG